MFFTSYKGTRFLSQILPGRGASPTCTPTASEPRHNSSHWQYGSVDVCLKVLFVGWFYRETKRTTRACWGFPENRVPPANRRRGFYPSVQVASCFGSSMMRRSRRLMEACTGRSRFPREPRNQPKAKPRPADVRVRCTLWMIQASIQG